MFSFNSRRKNPDVTVHWGPLFQSSKIASEIHTYFYHLWWSACMLIIAESSCCHSMICSKENERLFGQFGQWKLFVSCSTPIFETETVFLSRLGWISADFSAALQSLNLREGWLAVNCLCLLTFFIFKLRFQLRPKYLHRRVVEDPVLCCQQWLKPHI